MKHFETTPMLVGGQRVLASDGTTIDAVNPATGDVIGRFPAATDADVEFAVQAGMGAFGDWSRTSPEERAGSLLRLADAIEEHAEELSLIDVEDNGSPLREMRKDAATASAQLRYFAGIVMQLRGETIPSPFGRLNLTIRQPFGVVARIIPFNHPFMFAATKIAAPLAAGNVVILKPSEHTSLSALRLADFIHQIFPPGVVNIVTGFGHTTGDALVRHPQIRRLAFIGSAETGRAIQRRAAEVNVKHVTLELGGKNPLVVFPDADLEMASEAAMRGMNFTWQGQSCGSTSRLLIHRDVYAQVLDALVDRLTTLRQGSPIDPETETGAIVNTLQLDKVLSYVRIGQEGGARLVRGGEALDGEDFTRGNFVSPALFADVRPDSRLAQEEIFGPILAAMPFDDYDHALSIANGVKFGLTASVFTRDLATAHRFARDVEAGYVWVNEVSRHSLGTPFGGVKDSGIGREEDIEELYSYTQSKHVHINFES